MPRRHLSQEARQRLKEAQLARCRNPRLADVVERNIGTILEVREEFERGKNRQDRVADGITAFSGSMLFVYLHVAWFSIWVVLNLGWSGLRPFDPFPFGLLTMIVSLEAIFLATFVLISQNRMALAADQWTDLDLQINLLSEYEITRILTLVDAMAERMGLQDVPDPELAELEKNVALEVVLEEMEDRAQEQSEKHDRAHGNGAPAGNDSYPSPGLEPATNGHVDSRHVHKGDLVNLRAEEDVIVNGEKVVAKGASATARVMDVEQPKRFGKKAEIKLDNLQVRGVDGRQLQLGQFTSGKRYGDSKAVGAEAGGLIVLGPIGLAAGAFFKGGHLDIKPGTSIVGVVENDITVSASAH